MDIVLEARNLTKVVNQQPIVDRVHFQVKKGETFGILGPSGAGKTATLKMAYGSSIVNGGDLFLLGLNVRKHSQKISREIGVVPQSNGLDHDFTVLENLLIYSRYFGISATAAKKKAKELLRDMLLEPYEDSACDNLTSGLQRRLAIARALLNDPKIIFIDEPTNALDSASSHWIWDMLDKIKKTDRSLIIATKCMEEAERLCDRIVIMDRGKFIAEGKPKDLILTEIGHEVVEIQASSAGDLAYYVKKIEEKYVFQVLDNKIKLFVGPRQDGKEAMNLLSGNNMQIRQATLSDVFLKLTGNEMSL